MTAIRPQTPGDRPVPSPRALAQQQSLKRRWQVVSLTRGLYTAGAPLYSIELRALAVADALGVPLTVLAIPTGLICAFGTGPDGTMPPATCLYQGVQGQDMGRILELDRFAKTLAGSAADVDMARRVRARVFLALGQNDDDGGRERGGSRPRHEFLPLLEDDVQIDGGEQVPPPPPPIGMAAEKKMVARSSTPIPTLSLSHVQLEAFKAELDAILAGKDWWPRWLSVVCQATCGMLLASLWLPVTPLDLVFTWLMGAVHGMLLQVEKRNGVQAMDMFIPLVVGVLSKAAEIVLSPSRVCFATVCVMSSFTYFPGVPITLAMVEFAAHNTVTGVARVLDSFLRIFKLGFGMVLGSAFAAAMVTGSPAAAYLVALNAGVDSGMAAALSSLQSSLVSNVLARRFNHPGIATLLAGLIWLNPGPPFVRGALLLLTEDVASSVGFATEAVIRALSIVIGLYVSRLLSMPVWRKRTLADLSA
ncbi:hypothetical protein BC828DRAFT_397701 [Blastocladiella britannica]|nr:hypothetical protein BC828DRAFT_397701 [Blastocladiella britannica]